MVKHERVADHVYMFQSEVYAEVTSGVIVGPDMAVVIDTLAYQEETLAIRDFVERELQVPVRYVINTHYHADHSWGNCFFPGATIMSSALTRDMLESNGIESLDRAKKQNPSFRQVKIQLPHMTFNEGHLGMQVGKKTMRLIPLPGHSMDGIGVLLEEDRVLFSGDLMMTLPYIVDGDIDVMEESLKKVKDMTLENIVQGHGDIILRGEIDSTIEEDLEYLNEIRKVVRKAARRKYPLDVLEESTVDTFGRDHVLLGGLVGELHRRNLISLYRKSYGEEPVGSEEYYEDF